MNVVVVDTGFANYHSVIKAVERAGETEPGLKVERTRDPDRIRAADKLVMPGQGGFKDCALAFEGGLGTSIIESVQSGKPFFGICLGLQVLIEGSEEAPGVAGLGLFTGAVRHLERAPGLKIPHMGWNRLESPAPKSDWRAPLATTGLGEWFYFDHSYHAVPDDPSLVLGTVGYGPNQVTACVGRDNVFATQFHPEKSQHAGLELLAKFLSI